MQVATNLAAIGGAVALVAACSAEPPTIMKTLPPVASEAWVPQDIATNVQDWDRAAKRIADGLEVNGLLVGGPPAEGQAQSQTAPGRSFFLQVQQDSQFLRQLKGALETEITSRGGTTSDSPTGSLIMVLSVDVVQWGSRWSWQPGVLRREAVWQAALLSGGKTALSFREPFYIFNSDISLYQRVSAPDEVLASTARRLQYRAQ
jgi:hypothetical protein